MTPGEVRDELVTIQERLRKLEDVVECQKSANVGYHEVCHEMTEGWEAMERAIDNLDEMLVSLAQRIRTVPCKRKGRVFKSRRGYQGGNMRLWHSFLVYFGIRPCCGQQQLKSNCDTAQYYEYECTNCNHIYRGGDFTRRL